MDWLSDFKEIAKQDYKLDTLKQDQWTGSLEIHILKGKVKVVKVHNELRGE